MALVHISTISSLRKYCTKFKEKLDTLHLLTNKLSSVWDVKPRLLGPQAVFNFQPTLPLLAPLK